MGRGASLQLNGMSALPDGTLYLIGDFEGTAVLGFGTDPETTLVSDGEDGFVIKYTR